MAPEFNIEPPSTLRPLSFFQVIGNHNLISFLSGLSVLGGSIFSPKICPCLKNNRLRIIEQRLFLVAEVEVHDQLVAVGAEKGEDAQRQEHQP
jgi:hypothetical protein